MKKTYIEPKNTVVALKVRANILQTSPVSEISGVSGLNYDEGGTDAGGITEGGARETISSPDAWDEW